MDPAERLRQMFDLSESVRRLAMTGLRERHPDCPTLSWSRPYKRITDKEIRGGYCDPDSARAVLDERQPDEILGYDKDGLPG